MACLRQLMLSACSNLVFTKLTGSENKKTILIDYSSPNIAKPFHLGHFRATVTGNFIRNINQAAGHKVIGVNYLGDWGTQFNILATGFQKYGNESELACDPLRHMYEIYTRANQDLDYRLHNGYQNMNLRSLSLENTESNLSLWTRVRDLTGEHLRKTYARMNVQFDAYEYESDYIDRAKLLVGDMVKCGLAARDRDGVVIFLPEKTGDDGKTRLVLLKSDGSTLYLTRDIAAALSRYDRYQFDHIQYVVEEGQRFHFKQLQMVLSCLGHASWANNCHPVARSHEGSFSPLHIPFGRVEGVSTRRGQGLFLSDILSNARQSVARRMQNSPNSRMTNTITDNPDSDNSISQTGSVDVADHLGVTALAVEMLRKSRLKPIRLGSFLGSSIVSSDSSQPTNIQADLSGFGLQYCHARLCSLQERCIEVGVIEKPIGAQQDDEILVSLIHQLDSLNRSELSKFISDKPIIEKLLNHLSKFPDMLNEAYCKYESHFILHHATQLTSIVNTAWKQLPVLSCDNRYQQLVHLSIFLTSRNILSTSLRLLGLHPLRAI